MQPLDTGGGRQRPRASHVPAQFPLTVERGRQRGFDSQSHTMRITERQRKKGKGIKEYQGQDKCEKKGGGSEKKEDKVLERKKITLSLQGHAGQTLADLRRNLSLGGFLFF